MNFLNAYWKNLIIINYEVDPDSLKNFIPKGTELDIYEDKCYLSLVGFMFLNTKVLGIGIPFHINFEEVNLRFYVKQATENGYERGVVFVREIVPKPAISWIARNIYHERYVTRPMTHNIEETQISLKVSYNWLERNGNWQQVAVEAQRQATDIRTGTLEEFISEHYCGFVRVNETRTDKYRVSHPIWRYHMVQDYSMSVNFNAVYGEAFRFLNSQKPSSVMLFEGSQIKVEWKTSFNR